MRIFIQQYSNGKGEYYATNWRSWTSPFKVHRPYEASA
jgi:hypothetical protein